MRKLVPLVFLIAVTPVQAETECFGESDYRVCSTTTVDSQGNMSITSTDNMGNRYSVDSDSYVTSTGRNVITSSDSMGNSYRVESWQDSGGIHSIDSFGNRCTITPSGDMIGC